MTSVFTDTTTPTPEVTMSTTTPANVQILVAIDMDASRDLDALLDALRGYGGRTFDVERRTYTRRRDGVQVPEYRIEFDAGMLRNTEAAGIAYRLGYVSSTTSLPGPVQVQDCGCHYEPQGYGGRFVVVCATHPERAR